MLPFCRIRVGRSWDGGDPRCDQLFKALPNAVLFWGMRNPDTTGLLVKNITVDTARILNGIKTRNGGQRKECQPLFRIIQIKWEIFLQGLADKSWAVGVKFYISSRSRWQIHDYPFWNLFRCANVRFEMDDGKLVCPHKWVAYDDKMVTYYWSGNIANVNRSSVLDMRAKQVFHVCPRSSRTPFGSY